MIRDQTYKTTVPAFSEPAPAPKRPTNQETKPIAETKSKQATGTQEIRRSTHTNEPAKEKQNPDKPSKFEIYRPVEFKPSSTVSLLTSEIKRLGMAPIPRYRSMQEDVLRGFGQNWRPVTTNYPDREVVSLANCESEISCISRESCFEKPLTIAYITLTRPFEKNISKH